MEEAETAVKEGGKPFGVVVIDPQGKIVWKDHDRVKQQMDPTAHGEVNAIRHLCKELNTISLEGYKFYTNAEPCPVCFGSMVRAKVSEIYFGARTEPDASLPIPVEEMVLKATGYKPKVQGEILADETLKQRRRLGGK